ncbi:MAG: ABC transporter permease [Chloroflexi bacterium]|nr:ABC transporter permease [Chloroflexota bacterium]
MAQTIAAAQPAAPARARARWWSHRAFRHRSTVIGGIILLLVLVVALTAGLFSTHDPLFLDPVARLTPPGAEHILGTDNFGRDTFSRVLHGARVSLQVGIGVALGTIVMGTSIGLIAGYFRRVDGVLMRFMDGLMAFPGVILALAIMAARGPSVGNVIFALIVVDTPRLARVVRSVVLTVRELQYVEAARAVGVGTPRILFRHILPNCLAILIVQGTFVFAQAILSEAGLSFLGVGTPPEIPSWGNMLGEARAYLASAPWTMLAPGAALMVAVLGLNLLGDGIRDLLDPRLRRL